MNDIADQLRQDLLQYPIRDLALMAKYRGLSLNLPLADLLTELAAANSKQLQRAEMGTFDHLTEIPVLESLVPNLTLEDMNQLCRTNQKFAKECRGTNIWRIWIQAHPDPDQLDELMDQAIKKDQLHIINAVLSSKLKLKRHLASYLNTAYLENAPGAMELLLTVGVDPNSTLYGSPLLINAVKDDKIEMVKILLKHGADVNAYDRDLARPAAYWAAELETPDILKLLVEAGAKYLDHALVHASGYGRIDTVKYLLERGANVNAVEFLTTPLINATKYPVHPDIVNILLEHGADPNITHQLDGNITPLMNAANYGYNLLVESLLKHGADPNLADIQGITALMYAAAKGNLNIVKMLVEAGADPATKNIWDKTAAMVAAENDHRRVQQYLNGLQ